MSYPSYPNPSQQVPSGPTVLRPPTPVTVAFWIYIVAAALSIVSAALVMGSDAFDQAIRDANAQSGASGLSDEDLANMARIIAIVTALVITGLYVLFAFKMRAGRNWARVVLTVLSALAIVGQLSNGNQDYNDASAQLVGWISAGFAVVAIIAMYAPASNAYFAQVKANRARAQLGY